jgi:RNA polymerase sigma factor (sigma-70 family)
VYQTSKTTLRCGRVGVRTGRFSEQSTQRSAAKSVCFLAGIFMDPGALDSLLDRLCAGDSDAACAAFRAYEPYLRMIVRRNLSGRLQSKFDSVDIVQSVWADLLEKFRSGSWHFENSAHLRAFLVRVTHNRFLNRVRRHRRALDCEQQLDGSGEEVAAADPRPSQVVQANDMWQRMMSLCPPSHQELLRLRREGLPLSELAARTGLHEGSVRRIFYDLARRVAQERRSHDDPE